MMRHFLQYISTDKQVADMLIKPLLGTSLEWSKCFSLVLRSDVFPNSGK
jgi:hypothetical protein